ALAVTDRNTLGGVVRAHVAARAAGLKLLVGAEITPTDAPPVVLLAMNRAGYGRLSALITCGRRRAPKGACRITRDDIAQHSEGLLAAVVRGGAEVSSLNVYREVFRDRGYLLAELHRGRDDARELGRLRVLSQQSQLPLLAANDV